MPLRGFPSNISAPAGLALSLALIIVPSLGVLFVEAYEAATRPAQLAQDRTLIAHTFEVIATAEGIRSEAQNGERSQRGFLLTGAPSYLQRYRSDLARSQSLLERLRQLTRDNPEQQRRIPSLSFALQEWIAERERTVDAYNRDGPAAAQELVRGRAGKDTLGAVSALIDAAIETENDLLVSRQERAVQHGEHMRQLALLSAAINLALLCLGIWLALFAFRRARDIERERLLTERRLNEQLSQAQNALAQTQKMEALGQLTGGVAHDFNNLLHVIKNALTLAEGRLGSDNQEVLQFLNMAQRNTDRAASTTARLLAFSRQQPLDPQPVDMNKLIVGMADLLQHLLGESVALETVLGAGLWAVSVDRNQLETAIINLAVNARDAMTSGGRLTVETSNASLDEAYAAMNPEVKPGQYAMIAVSDTGSGMTKEIAARAFDPFFTTKAEGQGTGLGLSQVFGFVKQSGGHVKIYSEPGHGTTVRMYFVRLVMAAKALPEEIAAPAYAGVGESILVVEDNEDVRAFTAQILRELGYEVRVAADGRQALTILEERGAVDLLFTDVGLPDGMSGRELAGVVQRRWPAMRVLYMTGYARNSIIHHGRLDPDVELIVKPFTQTSLAAKVRQVLAEPASRGASAVASSGQ